MKKEALKKKLAVLIQSEGIYDILDTILIIAYDQSELLPKEDKMGDWWQDIAEILHAASQDIRKRKPYVRY